MNFTDEDIDKVTDEICLQHFTNSVTNITQYPNRGQRRAIRKAVKRQNIALIGPPGTGKTFVSNLIDLVISVIHPGYRFSRTATTGMASTHICTRDGDEGKTFYRWLCSGPESMIGHTEKFASKIRTDFRCKQTFRNSDAFQIDEASMLNEIVMGHIDSAAREIRRNRKYMGGMQVILTGDIHQLGTIDVSQGGGHLRDEPPIAIPSILDNLPEPFEVVILTEMVRTGDPLHQAILKGIVSKDPRVRMRAIDILNAKCCPSEINPWEAVNLAFKEGYTPVTYSNKQVDLYNQLEYILLKDLNPSGPIQIHQATLLHSWDTLPREAKTYLQDKEGMKREEEELVKRRSFVQNLSLFPNQTINLRRNEQQFKNGQTARFIEIVQTESDKRLKVQRLADGETLLVDLMEHRSEYVPQVGFEQYPVIPNAAITTHKVQGSTLAKVLFDPTNLECSGKDCARLLYTSASRTTSLEGFRLTHKIPSELVVKESVQEALEKLWGLDYMNEYPTISLEELNEVYRATQ
jgi:hypothetical protein